ncbi:MAG: FAD-dependent oxidoreductase, partial [Firmicutes bacterium]|nr:FAD-dependent oxidoreductase [Bacillota bacterium]
MQVRIHEIKIKAQEAKDLSPQELAQLLLKRTGRRLRLPSGSLRKIRIAKESLDAREKPDVYRVFSVDVLDSEFEPEELLAEARRAHVKAAVVTEEPVAFPEKLTLPDGAKRPVIAGFGPCGIFAALTLAKAGLKPVVLERGAAMEERVAAVETFWNKGVLDPRTNVQFGEGGAGSFSDGKLTTGTKDPVHRLILQTFADAGADPD